MEILNNKEILGDVVLRATVRKMIEGEITAIGRNEIRKRIDIVLGEILSKRLDINLSMTDFIKNEIRTYLNTYCRNYMYEQMKIIAMDIMSRAYHGLKNED